MADNKKLLVFCSAWMLGNPQIDGWDIIMNTQEPNPLYTGPGKFDERYVKHIEELKPDVVLSILVGCSEQDYLKMRKPEGPKYISWSTDSYRHTLFPGAASDVHISSIPDATLKENCEFLPLFFGKEVPYTELFRREITIGVHCRNYSADNSYRQKRLADIKARLGELLQITQHQLTPEEYLKLITTYKYGLNIPVYADGLPNFRSFECGACGVMPVSFRNPLYDLDKLFDGNIVLIDKAEDVHTKCKDYDPKALQHYYRTNHSFEARLKTIIERYCS